MAKIRVAGYIVYRVCFDHFEELPDDLTEEAEMDELKRRLQTVRDAHCVVHPKGGEVGACDLEITHLEKF